MFLVNCLVVHCYLYILEKKLEGKRSLFYERDTRSGLQNHPWHVLLNKAFHSSICLHLDASMFVSKVFSVDKKKVFCSDHLYDLKISYGI